MKYFLQSAGKFFLLMFLLTWERVLGLPLLFVLLSLLWLDKNFKSEVKFFLILIALSFLLAVVYQFSWIVSIILFSFGSFFLRMKLDIFSEKKTRVLISTLLINLIMVFSSGLEINFYSLIQLIISYFFVLIWLRLFRLRLKKNKFSRIGLLDDYGF